MHVYLDVYKSQILEDGHAFLLKCSVINFMPYMSLCNLLDRVMAVCTINSVVMHSTSTRSDQRRLDTLYAQLKIILFNLLFPGYYEFYYSDTLSKQSLY